MAMRTVRLSVRVVVVVLLLSGAAVPALATVDGTAAVNDHHVGDVPTHVSDDRLRLSSPLAERATATVGEEHIGEADERLEHVARYADSFREVGETIPSLLVLGYSRYDGSDPLENTHREDVYEEIAASPGIYLSKLSDELFVHRSTVRYHVRVLEAEGLIAETLRHGRHRVYPVEITDTSLVAALDEDATAAVLWALFRFEPASVSVLAEEVDRAPSTVSHHLTRLADDGFVVRERDGNAVLTRLTAHVREALHSTETPVSSVGESVSASAD